jgi:hypothetical protein
LVVVPVVALFAIGLVFVMRGAGGPVTGATPARAEARKS